MIYLMLLPNTGTLTDEEECRVCKEKNNLRF